MKHLNVLYEDNHVIVIEKPVNIPVQADVSGDTDLQTMIKDYIAEKYNKPGNVFLGIVHRLDRPVGGIMVFARTSKAASRLSETIRKHEMSKYYHVVVNGVPPEKGTLTHWLLKDGATNMVRAFNSEVKDAKKAILHYERVGSLGDSTNALSILKIELVTGRAHQIRVQCLAMGHPIWGDQRYNKTAVPGQQIALFASTLSFPHPTTREPMNFSLDLPGREPWKQFRF